MAEVILRFSRCLQAIQQRKKVMDLLPLIAVASVNPSIRTLVPPVSLAFRDSTIVHRAESVRPRE
jgi:hypothetical protein